MATTAPEARARLSEDVEAFVARSAIATNLARHSRGIDRNDLALLLSVYHPDAEVAYGMFEGRAVDFASFLTDAMAGGPVTSHRTSIRLIRVDGSRARSESSVIAYARTLDGEGWVQRLIGGRYLDRHEQRGGAWRIVHRTYVLDWNANMPSREAKVLGCDPEGAQRERDPAHRHFLDFRGRSAGDGGGMSTATLEEALAKQALHDLVTTYARGVDRADETLIGSVFHADAETMMGVFDGPAPGYIHGVAAMIRDHLKSCFHSIGNEYFEVDGDRAVGETYVIAHMLSGDGREETLTGGRYLDRFEKRDGVWKISYRRFVQDWNRAQPATMETGGMYEDLRTRGGYAPDDPSIAFWATR